MVCIANIGPPNRKGGKNATVSNGKATLRLRAKGPATVEDAVSKIHQQELPSLGVTFSFKYSLTPLYQP